MKRFLVSVLLIIVPAVLVASEKRPSGAAATVVQLYEDFGWEAVIEPGFELRGLIDQPRAVLAKYFDNELTALLLADRACQIQTHMICALDFGLMWDSQDPSGATVTISATKDAAVVLVDVRYSGPPENVRHLSYRLRKMAAGWRIGDIDFLSDAPSRRSLATLLRRGGK